MVASVPIGYRIIAVPTGIFIMELPRPCARTRWTRRDTTAGAARSAGSKATSRRHCTAGDAARGCPRRSAEAYQLPVFGIDSHGSAGASAAPCCSSSIEIRSGERTNAMRPSRGGRLMVMPIACRCAQLA